MDLRHFIRALRAHAALIVLVILVCAGAASVIDSVRKPSYTAHTQLFVSTTGASSDLSQTYQGGLFSQQRVQSYAQIVDSPAMATAIIDQLGLDESVRQLQAEITATVPVDTVLIDITVKNRTAARAQAIAGALAQRFPRFVNTLETPQNGSLSPIKISVTSQAALPNRPTSPKTLLDLALAILVGLALGVGAAVAREVVDTRIKEGDVAGAIIGAPILGSIVADRQAREHPLAVIDEIPSIRAEEYRRLRTNIRIGQGLRSLVVSSAVASEGKTTVVANLGISLAQAGYRVVLVDANLRRPALGRMLGRSSVGGLSDVLVGKVEVQDAIQKWRDGLPLGVITSGAQPPNPSELLGSQRFAMSLEALTQLADVVILDSPPLLEFTDAAILARMTSGTLLVTRLGSIHAEQLEDAAESLRAVDGDVIGVVMNGVPVGRAGKRRNPSRRSGRRRNPSRRPGVSAGSQIQVPVPPRESNSGSGANAGPRRRRGAGTTKRDEGASS